MTPLVSVIIPTYNRWPMLRDAVESVLRQSFRDFELIIVDDGSTDETARELAKYGHSLRLVWQQRRGVATARNAGVRAANGQYIAFLDSDDFWLPKKLEIQTVFMQRNRGIDICQTEEVWIRRGIRVNPRQKHRKPCGDIFHPSLDLCLVSPSAVMMTRALFQQMGGFDETFPVCEDYDLWLRVATAGHAVALISTALVVKRGGHSDQLSHSIWGLDRFRIAALQKLLRSGLQGERKRLAIEVLTKKVSILAHGARKRGKEQEAQRYEQTLAELVKETGMSEQKIREYGKGKGFHPQTLDRWLRWDEPDRDALLAITMDLKIGENHLRDLMDWLEEIALRDGIGIRTVLKNGPIGETLSDPRLGRADKVKRIKGEVRRLRFPRLSRTEDAINARIRDLKLQSEIKLFVPPGLEGGTVKVEFTAGSQEEFRRLVSRLAEVAAEDSMREIFSLLRGESVEAGLPC